MGEIVRRAAAWGVAGMLIGPAAIYCLMLLVLYTDASCQAGAVAGCKLDIAFNLAMGVVAGFALFFGVTFIRGLMRR